MDEEQYLELVELVMDGGPIPESDLAALDAEARARVAAVYAQIAESD